MKDFGKLYQLFKIDEIGEIPNEYIIELKNRYKELIKTYSEESCPNFFEDSVKLLKLINTNNLGLKEFLNELKEFININLINKILSKLARNDDIKKDLKKSVANFFTEEKNTNPEELVSVLNINQNLRSQIFQGMNRFILTEDDIFDLEENEKFKVLKNLMDSNIIEENKDKKNEKELENYLKVTMKILEYVANKLEQFEIGFPKISKFMNNEENEGKLLDIIYYIYYKDLKKSKTIISQLKKKFSEVQEVVNKYEKLLKYFNYFFPKTYAVSIQEITSVILDITESNSLNTLETKYETDFQKYEKYYEEAENMDKYMKSIFFIQIYKETKKQFEKSKDDDSYYLDEAKNRFNELKKLFENKGSTSKINPLILEICIKAIKDNPDKLSDEIKNLKEIFQKQDFMFSDKIYEEFLLLSQKDLIFDISVAIDIFISEIKGKATNFLADIKKIKKNLTVQSKIETIRESKKKFGNYGINIDDGEDFKFLKILLELKQNPECIEFLFNTSLEDCSGLKELILESDNYFLTISDILDTEKCITFFKQLGPVKEKTDIEIINILKEKVLNQADIILFFQKFIANFAQIKTLKSSRYKSENLKYQIDAIFKDAIFEVNNENDRFISFLCIYNIIEKDIIQMKRLYEDDIKSLRDRTQLTKDMPNDYKYLIEVINETFEIHSIMRDICKKGYPKKFRVQIKLTKEKIEGNDVFKTIYMLDLIKREKPEEIKEILNNILKKLKKEQKEAYETNTFIRIIYGRKFNLFYDYFHKLNDSDIPINSFLKYLTNDLYEHPIKNFVPEKSDDEIKSNINDCEKYISELFRINDLSFEKIYSQTIIKKKDKYQGFFTFKCEKLETNLYQVHKHLTGNSPIAQNVLFCNKDTYNEEIFTFIYRAVKCEYNSCFIIAGVEYLEYEQTLYMIDLFDSVFEKENNIKSCIIFLYTNNNAEICMNVELKKYKQFLEIDDSYKNEKYEGNDIEIISSDKSGVGKSTQIRKSMENEGKKWKYFPFGGVLKREEIINRLMKFEVDENCVVHLDLYDTDNIYLMNEFLLSFLILRYYGKDENIFYLSKKIKVKIEIPNTFINFIEKFPILTLFKMLKRAKNI